MKKAAAFFFLSLMLLVQTPLQQVLRLPILIEHFQEHRSLNKDISLAGFLVLHYFSDHPKDADYERDMQLPFKADDLTLISSTVVLPVQEDVDFIPTVYEEKSFPLQAAEDLTPRYSISVFQPPKMG